MRAALVIVLAAGCGFDSSSGAGARQPDGSAPPPIDAGPEDPDAGLDAAPPLTCETPWVAAATGCYLFVKDVTATFDNAQLDCQAKGGHLVVEDKQDENQVVAAGMVLTETDRFWIGLHDPAPDDNVFVWVTGLRLIDPHWAATEPSNSGDCVNSRSTGTWGDRLCTELKWYACEKND